MKSRPLYYGAVLTAVVVPTFCFIMAAWHARTLDYGERWGTTGFVSFFAIAALGLAVLARESQP